MELYLIFVGIILVIVYTHLVFVIKGRTYFYSKKLTAPPWADNETKQLVRQFNRAWSMTIERTVNVRIKKENTP